MRSRPEFLWIYFVDSIFGYYHYKFQQWPGLYFTTCVLITLRNSTFSITNHKNSYISTNPRRAEKPMVHWLTDGHTLLRRKLRERILKGSFSFSRVGLSPPPFETVLSGSIELSTIPVPLNWRLEKKKSNHLHSCPFPSTLPSRHINYSRGHWTN